jgi:hypothetical protein
MPYEHFVAAQRQWKNEDRASRLGRHEPVPQRFRPAPRPGKPRWQRLVDWWRTWWRWG